MRSNLATEEIELSDAEISAMLAVGSPRASTSNWEPPTVEELQPGLPQLKLIELIARGGMGAVYKGVQTSLNRLVAIKVLPPDVAKNPAFAERFKEEGRSMAKLSHPGIVSVFDAGQTTGGLLYFVMEFIEGTDVGRMIEDNHRLPPQQALEIIGAVCEALAFAHESGIIHRDIKPSNIMIDRNQRVKIADFGLAKMAEGDDSHARTRSRVAIGTPDFVAPEALNAGTALDQRADLYAVGVTLYQMLTGQIPRGRFEMPSTVVPTVDRRVDAIVDRAMKTDRDQRYATATQLRTEVVAVLEASSSIRTQDQRSKQPWLAWTLATAGVLSSLWLANSYLHTSVNAPPPPASSVSTVPPGDAPPLPTNELDELLNSPPLPPPEVVCDLPRGRWAEVCATEEEFPGLVEGADGWQRLPQSKTFIPKKAEGLNWGVRATFRHLITDPVPELVARNTHTANYNAYLGNKGTELVLMRYDATTPLASRYLPLVKQPLSKPVRPGQPYTLELFAIGRTLVARIGEDTARHVLPNTGETGRFGVFGADTDDFRDVQFLNLDGLNAPDAFKLARITTRSKTAPQVALSEGLKREWPLGRWAPLALGVNEVPSLVSSEDGWLRVSDAKTLRPANATGFNWGIRVTFRGQEKDKTPELILRETKDTNFNCYLQGGKTLIIQRYDATAAVKYQTLVSEDLPTPIPEGDSYTLTFYTIDDLIMATVGDHTVRVAWPGVPEKGLVCLYGPGFDDFRDVQLLNLDGLEKAAALKQIGL